jgi:DNA-binding HxlR family transcriptional regulator
MSKSRFSEQECPIAQALDEIGDWWTLLIVREAMYGTRRFEDFQGSLGIARNILSDRLKRLVGAGILEKVSDERDGRAFNYILTPKGRALWPVIISLLTWSNRWVTEPGKHRIEVQSRKTGVPIRELCAVGADDEQISLRETVLVAGPGASDDFRARIEAVFPPKQVKES